MATDFADQLGFSGLDQLNEVGHNMLHIAIEQLRRQNLDPPEIAVAVAASLPDHLIEGSLVQCVCMPQKTTKQAPKLDPRATVGGRPVGYTAMHMVCNGVDSVATRQGVLEVLLQRRASLESRTLDGATALIKASAVGAINLVRVLLAARADVEAENARRQTAVDVAGGSNATVPLSLVMHSLGTS